MIRGFCLIITAIATHHQSPGSLGKGGTQPGQNLPPSAGRWVPRQQRGEHSATVLIRSLMETFKCHWCLEPNVILRSHGWDGRPAAGQCHREFVASAGHPVVQFGSKPIFSTVTVAPCHDNGTHERGSLQLAKCICQEDGSEETAQTRCCVQALVHTERGQPGQVEFIEFFGAEGIASKKDQHLWYECSGKEVL